MPTSSITSDWSASFSTSSSESLEITSAEREEDSVSNVEPGSDVSGGDTQHACSIIVIALKAHEKLRLEPFVHALQNLVEEKNCKLVVICCMSRIQSEIGVDLLLDENAFRGVSKKKMDGAISTQRKIVLNFLEPIIAGLQKREIQIELQVAVGSRCDDILVKAAKKLRPHWVVLDLSFSGRHLKKLHKVLECNLVLMKKKGSKPVILPCSPKCSGPASHPHDRVSVEVANPSSERSRSPCPRSTDSSSEQITPAVVTTTSGTTSPARAHDTRDTDTSNTDSETETRPLAAIPTPLPTQVVATQTPSSPIHPGRLIGNPPLPTQVVATQSPSSPIHPGRLIGNPPAPSPTEFATSSPGRTVMGRRPAHAHAPDPSPVATQTPDRGYGRHLASSPPKFARQLGQTFGRHPAQGPALSQVGTQNPGRVLGLGAPSPTQDVTHRLRAQVPPARLSPAPVALTPSLQASMWPGPASRFSLPFIPPAPPDSTGNSATRSQAATRPTPPSCRTSTVGGQNRTEEIPYEIALAMAIKASILSASEEGVPVPQSALQQGSLGDEYNGDSGRERRPSDGSVLVDLVPPTGPTSSSRDEDRRPSAEPSQRPIEGDFWGQLESDQRFHNYWALPPAPPSVIRARTSRPGSRLGQLPIGDNPRRLESSGSGSAVSSSAQSSTRGTSPFAPSASVESRSPYPSVDTSPIELVTDESTVGSSERPPRELQKDINSRKGGECAVCWDAQANAVCVPCGHVAGCMDCLTAIKATDCGCPVCRVPIQQVIKIYVV